MAFLDSNPSKTNGEMTKNRKIVVVILAILALVAIRGFSESLFYDPLILFFKTNYQIEGLPELDFIGLLLNLSLRFWMNTLVSLVVLWVLFQKREIVQLSLLLYAALFVMLMVVFSILIKNYEPGSYQMLFYVRRFLIHPLPLLLLIPAFYFHSLSK